MGKNNPERKIALCYIRQSHTRDENDMNSPERQRSNIETKCQEMGWIPEFYEDAEGHKSGRHVKNRPGWLALEKRLSDPDVVALVANDLARLHRKGWRVGDLVERLDKYNVNLILAAPGRQFDFSSLGKIFLQFTAIIDEYYAEDISQRAKDSVAYRKKQGKSIGKPPFGTLRRNGYLVPDNRGVWLLTNGRYLTGLEDEKPENGVTWFGYYEAVKQILTLYAEGNIGIERLAYQMDGDGWLFCDRKNQPRPITGDDIRRVVSSWGQYGGIIIHKRSKDFKAYELMDVDELPFNPERAVFPVDLLRAVARKQKERSVRPVDHGKKAEVRFYPLAGLVYCAHCEELARREDNLNLRSLLTGSSGRGTARYRHKSGVTCGCVAKSVKQEILDADFSEFIKLLTINPDMLPLMTEMALRTDRNLLQNGQNLEAEKAEAIALCRRRIDAAINLYRDGVINRDTYLSDMERNEREIAHWEAMTTDSQKVTLELAMCMEAVDKIAQLWDRASDEDRQGMARHLFTSVVYDVDLQQIVDFRLKPWADRFLVLRAELHEANQREIKTANQFGLQRDMPHTGFEPVSSA